MKQTPEAYKAHSDAFLSGPSRVPTQYCSACGLVKETAGGSRKAALKGPVTRWNPLKFVCADCQKGEKK